MLSKRYMCTAVTTVIKKTDPNISAKPFKDIPGPKPLPLIGNVWRYLPIIGDYSLDKIHLTYAKLHEEFGCLVREKMFADRVLVHVFDPRDMHTVYANEGRWPRRLSHRALAQYRSERPDIYSGPGLFPSNGEEWFRFRQLFQNILMNPSVGQVCSRVLEEVTDDLIHKIPSLLDQQNEVDIQPILFSWALECIGAVTLNRRLGCLSVDGNDEAMGLVQAANNIHRSVHVTEHSPLFYKRSYKVLEAAQDYLASIVGKYMEEALDEIHGMKNTDSILAKMVHAKDVGKKDLFTMLLDMFLAGIDTTAYTLAFCLYNLAINQASQETLRKLLLEKFPSKKFSITDSRPRLPYLQLVIKETLRVNPVSVGNGRILPSDIVLSGYHVPAGTMVILQHQVASLQDEHFPEAERFFPERWMKLNDNIVSSPFGYGPRMCIGMRIARKELQLAIAKLVRNFIITYHHERVGSCNRLINVPDKPVRLRFQPLKS